MSVRFFTGFLAAEGFSHTLLLGLDLGFGLGIGRGHSGLCARGMDTGSVCLAGGILHGILGVDRRGRALASLARASGCGNYIRRKKAQGTGVSKKNDRGVL